LLLYQDNQTESKQSEIAEPETVYLDIDGIRKNNIEVFSLYII